MTDLFDDDDLFAPRSAPPPAAPPAPPPPPPPPPPAPAEERVRIRWIENTGTKPREAAGKRVAVKLRSGEIKGEVPVNEGGKLGWDADTTRWSLLPEGHPCQPFDVVRYRVL